MFLQFGGLGTDRLRSTWFGLSHPTSGINIVIAVECLRFDLTAQSPVLDAAVCVLSKKNGSLEAVAPLFMRAGEKRAGASRTVMTTAEEMVL
uniref:Uncharacterized protein n=1 Tax=Chromera velia CCMP2878 TaxID=1169474 RepID=A0A0G4IC11_9ALVE|mmetsp:Transcript_16723/g.33963  ORF Transcript_16723/g.33963 Transcript_16723/m.33963 type:complete len:92 (-) Transcript_16723:675-950(-)|eukprot:Cvel_13014.t1-p1 / transcript=Cvel_13014.t1 / gene=Cvel_13014 / organism=Chromera_velia_CCMP2878 / gene_product=hypothetical protein / transcript_product=hypothetical protein / location=Cvel_scaffold873:47674-47946(+) / protein_length=91 / sequence_SO=supercontig / SO=protein_coding / is_pseudo=false